MKLGAVVVATVWVVGDESYCSPGSAQGELKEL